ncbi:MAG TPA: peptidylprolyl isomerase, partial [Thermoanaerobaculia bacterium]|nr:peptidylprolyl isomerase [Thermoanaerobaculia bacterium]
SGGGKLGFLNNYIGKRLLLQKASQSGFDKRREVQAELEAAKESALFDLYVREEIGGQFIEESTVRAFYDENPDQFTTPERVKVRTIFIDGTTRGLPEARALAGRVMQTLFETKTDPVRLAESFDAAAREHSEHASASKGGDLGWVDRSMLDKRVADAAFGLRPGTMSGLIEAENGIHLLLVEGRQPEAIKSYEDARAGIREFLISRQAQNVMDVVSKTTSELRATSKVTVYADNVD